MRNNISLALLFILVFVLVAVINPMNISDDDRPNQAQTHFLPDYYIKDLKLVEFAPNGEPNAYIYAQSVSGNHNTPDLMSLTNPEVIWHQSDKQHWNLSAKQAQYDAAKRQAQLKGDVSVSGSKTSSNNALTINAQQLDIDLQAQTVTSQDSVFVRYNRHSMHAGALSADLKDGHIQLTQNVDSRFHVDRSSIETYQP